MYVYMNHDTNTCTDDGYQASVSLRAVHVLQLTMTVRLTGCMYYGQVENAEVRKPKYGNGSTETEVRK